MTTTMITKQFPQSTYSVFNKHPMGCKAQLALKCLFTLTLLVGDFDPQK